LIYLLDVQINSVPLYLIDFRKFITGDVKWVLCDNLYKRKRKL